MLLAAIVDWNGWGTSWLTWFFSSLLDASLVLVVAAAIWLAVRRFSAAALGCLLFLLVLVKLVVPLEIPVPDAVANWSPRRIALQRLADVRNNTVEVTPVPVPGPRPAVEPAAQPVRIEPEAAVVSEAAAATLADFAAAAPSSPASDMVFIPESFDSPIPSATSPPTMPVDTTSPVESVSLAPIAASTVPSAAASCDAPARLSLPALFMLAWLGVATGLLVRSLWRHTRFWRQLRRGREINRADLHVDLQELACRMGIRRSIRVIETDALSSPAVCGILRPVIVLPRGLLGSMAKMHLEWILLHELAHIRRHDLAIVWFQWLMAIVHFLNPAVWIANRMVNRLREYACDDLALVHAKASRIDSSEAFMTVVRHAASRPLAVSGVPGVFDESARASCFRRMTRLLDTKRRLRVRFSVGSAAVLVLAVALALPGLRPAGTTTAAETPSEPQSAEPAETSAAHLTGVVVDSEGQAAPGCTVQFYDHSTTHREWLAPATTDAQGKFTLPVADENLLSNSCTCAVRAVSPDGRQMALERTGSRFTMALLRDMLNRPLTLTLMPLRETVVEVRDGSGRPVAGATVEGLVDFGQMLPSFTADKTDASGQTRLAIPEGVRIRDVIAQKSGAGLDYFGNHSQTAGALLDFLKNEDRIADRLPDTVRLVLDGAVTYRAQFKDSTGKPIPDLYISPGIFHKPGKPHYLNSSYSRAFRALTNAQGIAAFDWIPTKLEQDRIHISLHDSQYPNRERLTLPVKSSDDSSEADIVLELAAPAIVTGKISDPDGTPLAGVAVTQGAFAGLTDAGGNYRAQVAPASEVYGNERTLTVSAPGWARSAIRTTAPGPGETAENVDAVLHRGSVVTIQIVVDEGKTPFSQACERICQLGRQPLSGPVVTVRSSGEQTPPFFDRMTPDDKGRCQTRLAPGTYAVTAQVPFFQFDRKPIELVVPESGEPEPVTIQASSIETKECRFRVVRSDASDVGLAGVTVWFNRDFAAELYHWRQAQTDAEGRVRVLRVDSKVGYFACSEDRKWAALGMIGSDTPDETTIRLKPAARVKGRFVDRRGNPVTDGSVRMEIDSSGDRDLANLSLGQGLPGQATTVGDGGIFELTGVVTGLGYRISLTKPVETIHLSGVRSVRLETVGTERIKVNDSGFIDLGDIECEYQPVEPRPAEQVPSAALPTLDAAAAENAIAAARAASAPSFHGIVTDPEGQPAAGGEVRLIAITSPGTMAPVYRSEPVTTDAEGRYSISTGPVQDGVAAIGLRAWSADGRQMGHVDPRILRKLYSRPLSTLYSVTLSRLTKEPVDIQLAPVVETVVHVQDEEGRPIPEASVEARVSSSLPPLAATVTDAEGNTILRYPKGAGIYRIVALKSKQGLDWFENRASNGGPFEAAGPLPDRVEITLADARTRRIQLLDTAGRALQGLTVRPNYFKKADRKSPAVFEWSSIASVVTDEQGIATFDWLPADASTLGGGPTLSFEPVSFIYCLGYGFRIPFNASENDRLCQIVLAPSAVVSGRVTRPDGSPAAGVRICPETHDSQNLVCFTDADGRYSFRVMPNKFEGPRPNSIGSFLAPLTVVVSNFSRDNPWVAKPLGPLSLTAGETVDDADFQLVRGARVTVRLVIDEDATTYSDLLKGIQEHQPPVRERPRLILTFLESREALDPADEIRISDYFDRLYRKSINFDETGSVSFNLPPGSFRFRPSIPCVSFELPEGIDPQDMLISARPETEFMLSEEDKERTFEIRVFTEVAKQYRLRVVQADSPDTTVAGAAIQVEPDTRAVYRPIELTTDENGEATLRRSTRPLTFLAYSTDRKLGASEEWLKLDSESDVVTIPMRPTRTATGRFLDKSGQPLKKCRVVCCTTRTIPLYSERGKSRLMLSRDPIIETTTDDEGRFTVEHLIPGVGYEIGVWEYLDEYERAMPVGDKRIEIPIDPSTSPIDCGDIRGRY